MTNKKLNKMFLNTLKAPYYDRMIGNSNNNFSDVVSAREMIENGVKLDKIESTEAKKPTSKKKERETHAMSYQGKAFNSSYSQQSDRGYQSYNQYARGAHKEVINPIIGPWHVFQLCMHLHMGDLLNHHDNRVITQEERDLNRKEPSLTHSNDLHRTISQIDPMRLVGSYRHTTFAATIP